MRHIDGGAGGGLEVLRKLKRAVPVPMKEQVKAYLASRAAPARYTRAVVAGLRDAALDRPEPPVPPPGRYIAPLGLPQLTRVLLVVLAAEPETIAVLARRTALAQTATMSFSPLFLVDSTAVEPLADYGWHHEYVMPEADWRAVGHRAPWGVMVAERIGAMSREWAAERVVVVPSAGSLDATYALVRGGFPRLASAAAPAAANR